MTDKVFVLCAGERGEGHSPVSAHGTLIQAKRATQKGFVQSDWVLQEITTPGVRAWKAVSPNRVDEEWIYHLNIKSVKG